MFTVLISAVLLICYIVCLIQTVAKASKRWGAAACALALAPSFVHGINFGFGAQTLLTALLFLGLTALLWYCGVREWGDRGSE